MSNLEKWALSTQSHFIDEQLSKHGSKVPGEIISFSCSIVLISIAFDPVTASF